MRAHGQAMRWVRIPGASPSRHTGALSGAPRTGFVWDSTVQMTFGDLYKANPSLDPSVVLGKVLKHSPAGSPLWAALGFSEPVTGTKITGNSASIQGQRLPSPFVVVLEGLSAPQGMALKAVRPTVFAKGKALNENGYDLDSRNSVRDLLLYNPPGDAWGGLDVSDEYASVCKGRPPKELAFFRIARPSVDLHLWDPRTLKLYVGQVGQDRAVFDPTSTREIESLPRFGAAESAASKRPDLPPEPADTDFDAYADTMDDSGPTTPGLLPVSDEADEGVSTGTGLLWAGAILIGVIPLAHIWLSKRRDKNGAP